MSIFGNNTSTAMLATLATDGIVKDKFIAISLQKEFNLSFVMLENSIVFVNGRILDESEYEGIGTTTLTLNVELEEGDSVIVISMSIFGTAPSSSSGGAATTGIEKDSFVAISGQTDFSLTFILMASSAVFVNGNIIDNSQYSGSGSGILKFNDALYENDLVVVIK